jgi:hypothetical protein
LQVLVSTNNSKLFLVFLRPFLIICVIIISDIEMFENIDWN